MWNYGKVLLLCKYTGCKKSVSLFEDLAHWIVFTIGAQVGGTSYWM